MSQRRTRQSTPTHNCPELSTGALKGKFSRVAQEQNSNGAIHANLTQEGVWFHDIEQGTELRVLVFEQGIWITPEADDGT